MRSLVDGWNHWGIRKQLTAVSIVLVAMPLCVGIVLFANLLTRALSDALATQTIEATRHVAQEVADGGTEQLAERLQLDESYHAQVTTADNVVVWTTSPTNRQPLTLAQPPRGRFDVEGERTWWGPGDDENRALVVSTTTDHHLERYVVHVASSQASTDNAVTVTTGLLLLAVPLVVLATGMVSWWVAGRALQPVDEMIDQVSQISSSTLDERVPLPPAHDELRALATTMNAMLERLEAASRSQERFVSDASHELRSPLAALSGALEIARTEDRPETWRELSPLMASEAARMTQLVGALLTLSRSDAAAVAVQPVDVDLDDLAGAEVARLRATGKVEVSARIQAVRVPADPMMLQQVLRNLCDNALRHARRTVEVTVATRGGDAVLQVADDGNGIAPADRGRVFDRFVRLEESRARDAGGSGLGLAIVAQVVAAHGGVVHVVDTPLGGACFEVLLPLAGPQSIARR